MKPKITKKFFLKENPYFIYSKSKYLNKSRNSRNIFSASTNSRFTYDKKPQVRQISSYGRHTSMISSISKSLKKVALNTKVYDKYIDFYLNLTQEHSFKTPKVNRYPLLRNRDYIPIKFQPLTDRESTKEKISSPSDKSNTIFLSIMKEAKVEKKPILKKSYEFNQLKNKTKSDEIKLNNSFTDGKDFGELFEKSLFESKFLKKFGLKKFDMNNSNEEKQKNFKFFYDYLKKIELKDIFKENNFHRKIKFKRRTAIKKENMEFKLDIYSLCFKFFSLSTNNNIKEKKSQKLYFPFILMPLFYLLDFISFKELVSEMIIFNKGKNRFEFIKESVLIKKVKKYFNYIDSSLKNKNKYKSNTTYNKKEASFPLIYDWIVTKNMINEEEEEENIESNLKNELVNNSYKCFKLKIVLPKIKFSVDNFNIKINKLLNKHIIANLLQNKFDKWENLIFFDLFSTKRFKIITNLIMLNKYYKLPIKKINLNKKSQVQNNEYEFFISQIGENYSLYFTLIPFIILILFGDKDKKFQKINLSLKESINLVKYGKNWGIINTLFKCMFIDKMKFKIFFKLDLLEESKRELNNNFKGEDNKNNIKAIPIENKIINEKEINKNQIKYKDKMYKISILNCTFRKIKITSINSEVQYFIIPQNILNFILNINDENKIFNMNLSEEPLIGKIIGENIKSILSAKESNIIAEEEKMIEQADIEDNPKDEKSKNEGFLKQISMHRNAFNRLKTFQIIQKNNNLLKKESKGEVNDGIKKEENEEVKIEEYGEIKKNDVKIGKRYNNNYVFSRGNKSGQILKKRVSITNSSELNQNRFDNITKAFIKKRTFNFNH